MLGDSFVGAAHLHYGIGLNSMQMARADAEAMVAPLADMPTVYNAGYTQDALKELVEAHAVHAVVRGLPLS